MRILFQISFAILSASIVHGQTNVSGGIFSNSTWTKANSPYIVTDTVVIFPGVTLTIQPGVTVRFDSLIQIEARQAKIVAVGTPTDSIIFTSNSVNPTPGKYSGIYINGGNMTSQFSYCKLMYSNSGIMNLSSGNGFFIKHSEIFYNYNGVGGGGLGNSSVLDSSVLHHNINIAATGFDVIQNCIISKNSRGVTDGFTITNCDIDSNFVYGIRENTGSISNCNIRKNGTGIVGGNPLTINNCTVKHNQIGIQPFSNQTIINSIIDSNSIGIDLGSAYMPAKNIIRDCQINYNGIGIDDYGAKGNGSNTIRNNIIEFDSIGIILRTTADSFYCNKICNSKTYALQYTLNLNTNCVGRNYWCTADSAATQAVIYDAYDDINLGIVNYMPIDSICFLGTDINETMMADDIKIYPNPFHIQTVITWQNDLINAEALLENGYGQRVAQIKNINGSKVFVSRGNLPSGVYFIRVTQENRIIATEKLLIID